MPSKDSISGQIIIRVVGAAIVGIGAIFVVKFCDPPLPPTAVIKPAQVALRVGENLQFSAEESSSNNHGALQFSWRIAGQPVEKENPVGVCHPQPNPALAFCQFTLPGTVSVSLTVADDNGLRDTATATVTVSHPNGYFGLVLFSNRPHDETADAYRLVLQIIDWQRVQEHVSRPIVLFDPDGGTPMFASLAVYQPALKHIYADALTGTIETRKI